MMTEEECTANGGHCFEKDDIILTSDPPQYPETCKHCGKKRIGVMQSLWKYRDA